MEGIEKDRPKAMVLGVGRMGETICHALGKLGFYVIGADSSESGAENFRKQIGGENGLFYLTDQNNADKMMETVILSEKPDVVISSLPYHQTEEIAYWCIHNEFRYCDLGGKVDVSKAINEEASKKAVKPIFTDLGLAPGWVNILAEKGFYKLGEAAQVKMMVGGIPQNPSNPPFNYFLTWSTDGLVNEYVDDCEILEQGEIITVKGMSQVEPIHVKSKTGNGTEVLEAFCTSGGASHTLQDMKDRGVTNCHYKTLRYKGHRDAVRFLIEDCKLSRECLDQVFKEGCKPKEGDKDVVLIAAIVDAWPLRSSDWVTVRAEEGGFSAMQRATAYPIACVASMMAEGLLDPEARKRERRDYWEYPDNTLTYKDLFVPYNDGRIANDELEKRLRSLGIKNDDQSYQI